MDNPYRKSKKLKKVLSSLRRSVRLLTMLSCIGMFLVLVAGTIVTKLDAGRGCGDDWPLCNGKFIPAYTLESLIEYNHRFISGIVGILVLLTFIVVRRHLKARTDAVFYAGSALTLTVVQALLGAMAVKWPQSDAVLALHFGISLLAFTSTLLLVLAVRRQNDQPAMDTRYTLGYRTLVWGTIVYCYIVVYLGAYVRHTESFGGCIGWPLCNGQLIPELSGGTGIVFIHRVAALIIFIMIAILTWLTMRRPGMPVHMRKAAVTACAAVLMQIISGALVTAALSNEDLYVFTALIHTVIISALFSVLCYMGIEVWRSEKAVVTGRAETRTSMD